MRRYIQAEKLADWRKAAGMTQRQLATLAGCHVCTVKYWERKRGMVSGVALEWILKALEGQGVNIAARQPLARIAQKMPDPFTTAMRPAPPSTCGAQTRKGMPCRCKPVPGKRRCKFHGGLSTGPKTAEGRDRIAEAQRKRWQAYRAGLINGSAQPRACHGVLA
jgi:hypothetical protein